VTFYTHFEWPLGRLLLVSEGAALTGILFEDGREPAVPGEGWTEDPAAPPFEDTRRQLREYWEGTRTAFTIPMELKGTGFQQRVWREIAAVPFGATISYRELAARAGAPGASRAAGLATGRNPIAIVVPCHRIVGSNGSLTGYGGGLDRKRALLRFEKGEANLLDGL
jgi:methylated-DNA-[protein]-cysteine S-methyltransferase